MTKEQAVKGAQAAFIVALDVGVEEDSLIEPIFEATTGRAGAESSTEKELRAQSPRTANEFLDSLSQEHRDAVLSAICDRSGFKI